MSSTDKVEPEDVCGAALVPDRPRVNPEKRYDSDTWYETADGVYCAREVWNRNETDRCIWHADVADKPVEELEAEWGGGPERLDRAVLRGLDLKDRVSLADCRLIEAELAGTNLFRANLTGANLRGADLTDATLRHADLSEAMVRGARMRRADLKNATIEDAVLREADLRRADLRATELRDTEFRQADLSRAILVDAVLENADLSSCYLVECNLSEATLVDADLEEATLTRANLFGTNFVGAKLYGAVLSDVQLNARTKFDAHYTGENDDPDKAAWTLRQLERLFRENALPGRAREAHLDRKDRRRKQYRVETVRALRGDGRVTDRFRTAGGWARQWARTALYGATMRYGESPLRVVTLSMLTVLAFGLMYPIFGGMDAGGEAGQNYGFEPVFASVNGLPGPVVDVLANLYFSAVTFTTLGYGDIQPATPMVELLATLESFVGALLMALLVFVLGRRATW